MCSVSTALLFLYNTAILFLLSFVKTPILVYFRVWVTWVPKRPSFLVISPLLRYLTGLCRQKNKFSLYYNFIRWAGAEGGGEAVWGRERGPWEERNKNILKETKIYYIYSTNFIKQKHSWYQYDTRKLITPEVACTDKRLTL